MTAPIIRNKNKSAQTNTTQEKQTMATKPENKKPQNTSTTTAAPAAASNGESAKGDAKPKKAKRQRVRLASPTVSGFWVRAYKDIVEKFGMPLGPDGKPLEVRAATPGGLSPEERQSRKAAKEAEKERIKNMSPEEKAAWAQQKRDAKSKVREEKKAKERAELMAKVIAGLQSGELKLDDPELLKKLG